MSTLHLVYRSYGGENLKGRPDYYSKALTLASFVKAASRVPDADVVFLNNGPIPPRRLALMERYGRVIEISEKPVGVQDSYRFSLSLPDREGWPDDDVVSYNEDDYLFHPEAFAALAEAARTLSTVPYFALSGEHCGYGLPGPIRPADADPEVARREFGLPRDWKPAPARAVGDGMWFNLPSTTATFSARVGTLREDMPIFRQCMRPFRNRWLDHETCLMYQGFVPYGPREVVTGLRGDFEPSLRAVARTVFLIPFRIALNRLARRQTEQHLLYAPVTSLAAHLERPYVGTDQDWPRVAQDVASWAAQSGFGDVARSSEAS